ncbi:putative DNA polymerase POL4 [Aspergillus campestris IBT 28561]|uniref:DNA polymerase n=1 Tax=Aspergillus campestris (strain IBT 28561) TaxID=1392248 RepID=A0A2I1D418_ASPC2|nr:putative DNA polymerase POL4 [Aspergillus campestris IBT 28561]PKY04610.1 putative DNA polymerase POL4 [Aspergillus campestris IBT 28561]
MTPTLADKEAFFSQLDELDSVSDGLPESPDDFDRVLQSATHELQQASTPPVSTPSPLEPTSPAPLLPTPRASPKEQGTETDAMKGSRKRKACARMIPEQQQIFKGLVFFFFPNSDVSPLRRLRIQKAQEYGAVWAKNWGDHITHVIVDKGLTFQEVLKHLTLECFPSTVMLLDESYPSECIKFRSILSSHHARFRILGMSVEPEPGETGPGGEVSTGDSLPLKPSGRELRTAMTPPEPDSPVGWNFDVSRLPARGGVVDEAVRSRTPPPRDALDEMIEAAQCAQDLPLEPLETFDDETATGGSDSECSDTHSTGPKRKRLFPEANSTVDAWQQNFVCMQTPDPELTADGPNTRTIEILQKMLDYYTKTDDQWRSMAYRKAIGALRRQTTRIVTRRQALSIPGVGSRLADKIEEIACTDRLRRLENTNTTVDERILQLFLGVYGAGIVQASRWLAQGYRSLADLGARAPLTANQRVGIEHYHDFAQRIPREEVAAHGAMVRDAVLRVDPDMQVLIGGSYRRGARNSGDIDVLITKTDASAGQIRTVMVETVIPDLFRRGFLQVGLATTAAADGSKWHGASQLAKGAAWRRIDLLFVPGSELGAALIYFTGNDIFNRSLRLLARRRGMRLNQRGLYRDVVPGTRGRLVEGRDERGIFGLLGVPWRAPEDREC